MGDWIPYLVLAVVVEVAIIRALVIVNRIAQGGKHDGD